MMIVPRYLFSKFCFKETREHNKSLCQMISLLLFLTVGLESRVFPLGW